MTGDALPEEDVHDADPHGGGATGRPKAGSAWVGYVDPESRGFHEAVQSGIAGILAGHAQWTDNRVFGVGEQGGDTLKTENGGAAPSEQKCAALNQIVIDPRWILLELL